MEPVEPSSYMREAALSMAVQHCQHRQGVNASVVLDIADMFLNWLWRDSD